MCDAVLKQGTLVGVGVLAHQEHFATVVLSQNDVSLRRVLLRVFQMLAHVLVVAAARVKENGCVVSGEKAPTVTKGVDELIHGSEVLGGRGLHVVREGGIRLE